MLHEAIAAALLLSGLIGLAVLLGRGKDNPESCPNEGGC